MKNMEEINKEYRNLCTVLGDIEVKLKGLSSQKEHIFAQLSKLDDEAAKYQQFLAMKEQEAVKEDNQPKDNK